MKFGKTLLLTASVIILGFNTSCETGGQSGGGTPGGAEKPADDLIGPGFLKTDYEPLVKWLDERFEIDYKHMTVALIFDQVPLNDIFYETSDLPTDAPAFSFASAAISRRDLLKKIAQHWKLKMTFSNDQSGTPTAVKVQG
ncbi:hypothetical protein N9B21_02645 [Verrucomicrobiales bacterium]|jgi:hypothetical protein|nr:hypothetical protein [Verrucomicrobiales bacterium]MDA7926915.1 hypothetical protein [Verrucomicrobiales bacterium]